MKEGQQENPLDELCRLIVGADRVTLNGLRARLDDPQQRVRELSEVLPQAIAIGAKRDRLLARSLQQPVDACLRASVEADPRSLADALFPVIGPAIRKAIAQALRDFLQTINDIVEQSLSRQGLQWRWEAWRSGRPFGEIVLRHTVQYRIEQVFLIHRGNGLLLEHAAMRGILTKDRDAFSAMLTAIQDFVADSFPAGSGEPLRTVEMGERTLWVLPGPSTFLACVVWGVPPPEAKGTVEEILERIHERFGAWLRDFDGDRSGLVGLDAYLRDALLAEDKANAKVAHGGGQRLRSCALASCRLLAVAGLIATAVVAYALLEALSQQRRFESLVTRLRQEPGTVVLSHDTEQGTLVVRGFRDPLARDPLEWLNTAGIDAGRVRLELKPYHSLAPPIVERRARRELDVPETLAVRFENGTLYLTGSASMDWLAGLPTGSGQSLGVARIDVTGVRTKTEGALDLLRELLARAPGIVVTDVQFVGGVPIVRGLIDPLAEDPERYAGEAGFSRGMVRFDLRPFRSMEPELVLARLRRSWRPPATVELSLEGSNLIVSGYASARWLRGAAARVGAHDSLTAMQPRRLIVAASSRLERMAAVLQPPPGVSMEFVGEVLHLRGEAPPSWVESLSARMQQQWAAPAYDVTALRAIESTPR